MGADPLLQIVGEPPDSAGSKIEKSTAPVTDALFCNRNPPRKPPWNELSEGVVNVNCQLPASRALLCGWLVPLPPHPDKTIRPTRKNSNKLFP
jgi:hypothetical protein